MLRMLACCLAILTLPVLASAEPRVSQATVIVAAKNSSERARASADYVCTGEGDQDMIRKAILALPAAGGTVLLLEGDYDIRKVPDTLGGILIDRSHVTLAGQGAATRLRQAAGQNTNVIRIIGSGVGQITIRDLVVDANRAENHQGMGDPKVSHARFEFCGIKAFRQPPSGPTAAEDCHDITIRNCWVHDAHRLGIMLEGPNMRVLDNVLGNAGSDVVEILTGPGIIRGNTVLITGQTHVAIGSDRANDIIMADNIVHVRKGGKLDIGFRSWEKSLRHSITGNVLTVDAGGSCILGMDLRGTRATVTGNVLHTREGATRLLVRGGHTTVTGNILTNVVLEIDDPTASGGEVILGANVLDGSVINDKRVKKE